MATVTLTDEQVVALVLQLPTESKRLILEALTAESEPMNEPEIVDKEGLLVVRAPLLQDISQIVEQEREARVAAILAEIAS
ncbi:MAG TPA: hypothetical protein VFJ58_01195 [Armatimonadota bacterium]|nr:hypothetical protein [Armatimonadota bacterium]